jgi:hypothetical protein
MKSRRWRRWRRIRISKAKNMKINMMRKAKIISIKKMVSMMKIKWKIWINLMGVKINHSKIRNKSLVMQKIINKKMLKNKKCHKSRLVQDFLVIYLLQINKKCKLESK